MMKMWSENDSMWLNGHETSEVVWIERRRKAKVGQWSWVIVQFLGPLWCVIRSGLRNIYMGSNRAPHSASREVKELCRERRLKQDIQSTMWKMDCKKEINKRKVSKWFAYDFFVVRLPSVDINHIIFILKILWYGTREHYDHISY